MNSDDCARKLASNIAKWVALMSEIHLPDIHHQVMELIEQGWYAEARLLLERAEAFIVERECKPFWRGFEVKGRIVAEQEFVTGIPDSRELRGVWNDPDYHCVMENTAHSETITFQYEKQPNGLYKPIAFLAPATGEWTPVGIEMPMLTFEEMFAQPSARVSYAYQDQQLANPGHVDSYIRDVDRDERKRRQKRMGQLFVKYGVTK